MPISHLPRQPGRHGRVLLVPEYSPTKPVTMVDDSETRRCSLPPNQLAGPPKSVLLRQRSCGWFWRVTSVSIISGRLQPRPFSFFSFALINRQSLGKSQRVFRLGASVVGIKMVKTIMKENAPYSDKVKLSSTPLDCEVCPGTCSYSKHGG